VSGTADDDTIAVALNAADATQIDVTINGEVRSFELARVRRGIRVNGRGGDDVVTVGATGGAVTLPALLNGGKGDDTLTGGGGDDRLLGARGDDDLGGGAGTDVLVGGPGQDVFQSTDAEAEYGDFEEGDDGVRIALSEAPAPVQASVNTLLAGSPPGGLFRESEDGATVYELEWAAGLGMSAKIQPDGTVTEEEAEIDPAALPAAVSAAVAGGYPKGEITEAETVQIPGTPQFYEVEVVNRRQIRELKITPAGEIFEDEVEGRVGG
jgi:hypothetical protein